MPRTYLVVAKKELRDLARDSRFRWATVIVWLLVAAALATAWPEHRRRASEREALRASAREQWLAQGAKNPHTAAHFGFYALKPHTPLTLIDPGLTTFVGTHVLLEAHWQNPQQGRAADAAPPSDRLGALSPATILQQLMPLVVILLGYGAFAIEREGGTWPLLLTQGSTPTQIGLGKLLARASALFVLVAPPLAGGAFVATTAATDRSDVLIRGGLLYAVYATYGLTYLAIVLWVSLRASSSRRALTTLLAFWIATTLIAPRAAADVSRVMYPLPSAFVFHESIYAQKRQGLDGHDPEDDRVKALRLRTLQEYGAQQEEDLPLNFSGLALQADEEYGNAVFERAYGGLWHLFDQQARIQRAASLVSPAQAVRFASSALAGSDTAHDRDFSMHTEHYRRRLVGAMNDDLTYSSRTGDFSYLGDRATWARVPDFAYRMPSAWWALEQEWVSFLLLALWCGASLAALCVALRSRKVAGGQ